MCLPVKKHVSFLLDQHIYINNLRNILPKSYYFRIKVIFFKIFNITTNNVSIQHNAIRKDHAWIQEPFLSDVIQWRWIERWWTNSHDLFTGSESGSSNSLQDLAASTTPSVETGSPTVPIPGASNSKQETDKEDIATGQSTHSLLHTGQSTHSLLERAKLCLLGAHSLKEARHWRLNLVLTMYCSNQYSLFIWGLMAICNYFQTCLQS